MHLQEMIQKENKIKEKTNKQIYPDTIKFYEPREKKWSFQDKTKQNFYK